jgi:CDP-4-dehydro-6-deoxyglucose reductase, E1
MTDPTSVHFPLVDSSYDNQEIIRCMETLLSGQLTMGQRVKDFEVAFAETVGAPYAVMVNSGSSANLLAMAASVNPVRSKRLSPGDRVAVPAVCWSTSVWPIIQCGLVPVMIDVDPTTLNLAIPALRSALRRQSIRGLVMVHVMGNSTELEPLLELVQEYKMILIEDTCESLGTSWGTNYLGTLGDFGTFSFYFSHHMTTIEGGMVVARTLEDYDLLRCLRAHGWSREQSNREQIERDNSAIDPRFLFINVGYNLRPMEIQAAFGAEQIRRLAEMNANRRANVARIREAFTMHPRWRAQLQFPVATTNLDPCWFGFPFLVAPEVHFDYQRFTRALLRSGIDTRPIVSGNMALQPGLKHFTVDLDGGPFIGAQRIHDRGLFIGAHAKPLAESRISLLVDAVLAALERDDVA